MGLLDILKWPAGKIKNIYDDVSGKNTAQKVEEFAKIYEKVLLGMHNELQENRKEMQEHKDMVLKAMQTIESYRDDIKCSAELLAQHTKQIKKAFILGVINTILFILLIGVLLWRMMV